MTLPLLTALAPRWETDLASRLDRSGEVQVVRRCADVAELVGAAAAGLGTLAAVSSDLRGMDRETVDDLHRHGLLVLGVHPPGDETSARALARWECDAVLAADAPDEALTTAVRALALRSVGGPGQPAPGTPPGTPTRVLPEPSGPGGPTDGRTASADGPRGEGGAADGADHRGSPDVEPGRVLVVWGPTGSPGRTAVAVNLAAELADPLTPVVLVDADTYAASVAQWLGVLDEAPGVAAAARAADQGTLDRDSLHALAPEVRPGLRVLTGLPRADRWPELRDVALADVLEECRRLCRWTVVDVAAPLEEDEELSFDTAAPRRNGATLTALEAADTVVVVGLADPVGLQRLVRGLDLLGSGVAAERVVVCTRVRPGPVGPEPGRRVRAALERFAGVQEVHLVPEDQEAFDVAMLHGQALLEVRPRSSARLALLALADRVAGREPVRRPVRERGLGLRRGARPATA